MKITLISPYPDITAFGMRTLSAVLKEKGHQTQLIFLPDPYGDDIVENVSRYQTKTLDKVAELCERSDLIGISLMTNFFDGAVQITRHLQKKNHAPIIWGGIHPTIKPEESIEYADFVCVGDGEEALVALVDSIENNRDYSAIPGIWCKKGGNVFRNALGLLNKNLDSYPLPDYSMVDHHMMVNDDVIPMTTTLLKSALESGTVAMYLKKIGYQTMTGRGCPHKCTYCINDTLKTLYSGQSYIRWRSTEHVMKELLWVTKNMPYIGFVWISDDAFFARSTRDIEEFCREYKAKINLPFSCLASPLTMSQDKMDLLIDAGLIYIQMGIQSGSSRIQELFNRKMQSNERILKAAHIINRYKGKMFPPSYDFILDVPYENTQDKVESLKLISQLPKPFKLQPFSLVLYPGTKLYQMAKKDGFIVDEKRDIYTKTYTMSKLNYLNVLILLSKTGKFPSQLLRIMLTAPVLKVLNSKLFEPLIKIFYLSLKGGYRFVKGLGART